MSFCIECGNIISADTVFCTNCGKRVISNKPAKSNSFISKLPQNSRNTNDWDVFFKSSTTTSSAKSLFANSLLNKRNCIVLTNRKALRESLGTKYLDFENTLRLYCVGRIHAGWKYHLLDASSNRLKEMSSYSWQSYVELLANGIDRMEQEVRKTPSAVLIVGDESIVPMAVFDNPLYDDIYPVTPDIDIDSDLPYATLSTGSPFENEAALIGKIHVGRIPTGKLDKGETGKSYFLQAGNCDIQSINNTTGFGLTAEVWQGASEEVAEAIGHISLHTSPDLSLLRTPHHFDSQARYFYFNVHGSDMDSHWTGEGSAGFMAAVAPDTIKLAQCQNALATEACYGARFMSCNPQESLLLSALGHMTLAFSGSSRIAYGPANSPAGLADLVAMEFLTRLKAGQSAGKAFQAGREKVLAAEPITPHDQLTVVEFNLFGDPTMVLSEQSKSWDPSSPKVQSISGQTHNIRKLQLPDVLGDVRDSLDSTWAKIRFHLNQYVYQTSPNLQDIEPYTRTIKLGLEQDESLQLSYSKKNSSLYSGRVIYADRSGKILQDCVIK